MTPDAVPPPTVDLRCGDALEVLRTLPDESVQTCVTSPPYYGLRDYGTGTWHGGDPGCEHKVRENPGGHGTSTLQGGTATAGYQREGLRGLCPRCGAVRVDRQIGLERTVEEYVARMVEVFREVRRVLRKDGTCWLNLGDSYAANRSYQVADSKHRDVGNNMPSSVPYGLKPKDLIGVPWRVAFALQADGWWLRSDIVWCLSGGTYVYVRTQKGDMPMTVKDLARLRPETVQLWNGERWTSLLGVSKSTRNGDELTLTLRSGERISCTPTHRFPTSRGLLAASEIRPGDRLVRVTIPEPDGPKAPGHVGEDAAWFAGLYLAEGSRSGNAIQIAGHAKEQTRWERVCRIAESYGGSATRTVDGNRMEIRVYGKVLVALLDELISGHTAIDKGIAPVCWQYGNDFLRHLLDGYLSGDGSWDAKNNRWRLGFARNYNLERDLRTLCARIGARLTLKLSNATYQGGTRPTFRGEIRFDRSGHWNERDTAEVVRIGRAKTRQVYDLGVADEPHLFALASGILTHNSKPNPMPESVTDRPTKAHEYVFLLAKSEQYFYDADVIKEPYGAIQVAGRVSRADNDRDPAYGTRKQDAIGKNTYMGFNERWRNHPTVGRNTRSVWTIATQPFRDAHFAVFPEALVERCVLAGSPPMACAACGAPWRRVIERTGALHRRKAAHVPGNVATKVDSTGWAPTTRPTPEWRPGCECGAGTAPAVVLDPFVGSGTTCAVAARLGRNSIGIDLNPDYIGMAKRRVAPWVAQTRLFQGVM